MEDCVLESWIVRFTLIKDGKTFEMKDILESWILRFTLILISILIFLIGNILWFGIAHFEKFGGDPKKRCISNSLSGFACFGIICGMSITILTQISRLFFGCFPYLLGTTLSFFRRILVSTVASILAEILLYKMLQVYKFRLIASLLDDFLSNFLILTTTFLTFLCHIFCSNYFGFHNEFVAFLTCQSFDGFDYMKSQILITFFIISTTILSTCFKKTSNQVHTSNQFNTSARNKALATTGQYILIAFIATLGGFLQAIISEKMVFENSWWLLPKYLSMPFAIGLIIPSLFYLVNNDARKHFCELFI